MGSIGPLEIGILALVVLLVFGPKRLPEMGRSLGKGLREFKTSISGMGASLSGDDEDEKPAAALTPASADSTAAPVSSATARAADRDDIG